MTNSQAQAYAVIALRNLIEADIIRSNDKNIYHIMDRELYSLFDYISEEEAEERAVKILRCGR